jgi:hypothetical protein
VVPVEGLHDRRADLAGTDHEDLQLRRSLARRPVSPPLGLVVDPHGVGDTVDVVEVRDHLDGVVDARVAPALPAKSLDVRQANYSRLAGDLDCEVAERPHAWLEVSPPVVMGRVLCQLFRGALGTEVVGVRTYSVVAVVRA